MATIQAQTLDVLLTADLLPDLDTFLSALSITCTYQEQYQSIQGITSYPFLPTFYDLIDPSVDITIQSVLESTITVYTQLNAVLIQAYKVSLDQPNKTHPRALLLQTIFQNTSSWIHLSFNTLILAISQINFSSFLLLNTHEVMGIDQVHLITVNDLTQKTLFKLQNSTRFFTPPQQWAHILSLVMTFFEYLFIHFPVHIQNIFSLPYNAEILQHLWVLPYSTHPTSDDNHEQTVFQLPLTIQQYQRHTFSLLLSQPCLIQHPQLSQFLSIQLEHSQSQSESQSESLENQHQSTTHPHIPISPTFLPLFAIFALLLTPLTIYSSPELLYIQSLRQAYLLSGKSHLDILLKFEADEHKIYHHTLELASSLPPAHSNAINSIDILSSPRPIDNNLPKESALPPNAFSEHSEITKLSLFYNNNAHLERLLTGIYQLDLAQQEKYYNICQLRTKIDQQVHLIIARMSMMIYNFFFIRLQCIHHNIIPFDGSFTKSFLDLMIQERSEYQRQLSSQLSSPPPHSQEQELPSLPTFPTFTPLSIKSPFFPSWNYQEYSSYHSVSSTALFTILPTLIMSSHHQQFSVSRPIKRLLFLLQFYLQSGYITIIQSTTQSTTPQQKQKQVTLESMQSLIIDTLSCVDYISSRITSPTPCKLHIPTNISILSTHYVTNSPLLAPIIPQTQEQDACINSFMISPLSPFFIPTTAGRDIISDPMGLFTQNALFQYPLHSLYTHHSSTSTSTSTSTCIFYFDLLLSPDCKHDVDYTASILPTQVAQDSIEGYYTPRFGNSINTSPLQSAQLDITGESINKIQLASYQTWKDVDHFSFLLFLFSLSIQQQIPSIISIPIPSTISFSSPKLCSHNSFTPHCAKPNIYSINDISTSGSNTTSYQSPSIMSPLMRYNSNNLPNLFSLGANDFRFIIDLLLAKLTQQPLYLSQLTYPPSQRIKYMIETHPSSSETMPPTPTEKSIQFTPSLLSLDLLTVLQLTTNLQFIPLTTISSSITGHTVMHSQPTFSIFMGLLFSADTSQFITPFDDEIDLSQLIPNSPYLPPSYYCTILITLIRLVLSWKEWSNYRQDDILEAIMDAIELLRRQKGDINELLDKEQEVWTTSDEILLDYVFAILGQFVIKVDEKATEQF